MEKFFVADTPEDRFPSEVEAEDHEDAARIVFYDWLRDNSEMYGQGATIVVKKRGEEAWKKVRVAVDYDPTITAELED